MQNYAIHPTPLPLVTNVTMSRSCLFNCSIVDILYDIISYRYVKSYKYNQLLCTLCSIELPYHFIIDQATSFCSDKTFIQVWQFSLFLNAMFYTGDDEAKMHGNLGMQVL